MVDDRGDGFVERLKRSPSYLKAYEDVPFLNRDELRPVRLQLELLKPEIIQSEHDIHSTIVVFGSARLLEPQAAATAVEEASRRAKAAPGDAEAARVLATARKRAAQAAYYEEAREFARIVSSTCQLKGRREYVIVTGGGPGVMEAANRGAYDAGAISIGLNITLPFEQLPNPYITPDLCFQFRYFAIRKMHFLMRAKALVAFPGGYGTFDELFETLTLVQTGKVAPLPIVLFGREFWRKSIAWEFLAEEGMISSDDTRLFRYADRGQEAWDLITRFHDAGGWPEPG
jgi:uncharacterized protein (TIGR00730 family)